MEMENIILILRDIARQDSKLAADASDYRAHADFRDLRAAIRDARMALVRMTGHAT